MMDFNGQDLETFFIYYTIVISIVTMGGLVDTSIGCLVHLQPTRRKFPRYGEEVTNPIKYSLCEIA